MVNMAALKNSTVKPSESATDHPTRASIGTTATIQKLRTDFAREKKELLLQKRLAVDDRGAAPPPTPPFPTDYSAAEPRIACRGVNAGEGHTAHPPVPTLFLAMPHNSPFPCYPHGVNHTLRRHRASFHFFRQFLRPSADTPPFPRWRFHLPSLPHWQPSTSCSQHPHRTPDAFPPPLLRRPSSPHLCPPSPDREIFRLKMHAKAQERLQEVERSRTRKLHDAMLEELRMQYDHRPPLGTSVPRADDICRIPSTAVDHKIAYQWSFTNQPHRLMTDRSPHQSI